MSLTASQTGFKDPARTRVRARARTRTRGTRSRNGCRCLVALRDGRRPAGSGPSSVILEGVVADDLLTRTGFPRRS